MGYLVSLSGIDGAGKSTQIKLLISHLKSEHKSVMATERMFTYFLLKQIVNKLRSVTGNSGTGAVKVNRKIIYKLWFIPAFLDIWISYIFYVRPLLSRYDYVIADRYYTDIWANLLYYGYLPSWAFYLIKFLPKPDKAFVLYALPRNIFKRELEFPEQYYFDQEKIYKALPLYIECISINANKKPKEVSESIINQIPNK